jgi:hypothetical protein
VNAVPLDAHRRRGEAVHRAARIWRTGLDAMDRLSIADAVAACYSPGGPDRDELARRIRADRASRTAHRAAA